MFSETVVTDLGWSDLVTDRRLVRETSLRHLTMLCAGLVGHFRPSASSLQHNITTSGFSL